MMPIRNKKAGKIFLSYAREDEQAVRALSIKLSEAGFDTWMDTKDLLPGQLWEQAVSEAIRKASLFIACLSRNSVNKRGFLQREIKMALDLWQEKLDEDIYLIPVRLEDCKVPRSLNKFNWVNLYEDDGFVSLIQAIGTSLEALGIIVPTKLRGRYGCELSKEDTASMIKRFDFFDKHYNWLGKGIDHEYELINVDGIKIVIDRLTDLVWQHSEAPIMTTYHRAQELLRMMNEEAIRGQVCS